jgi:transposase
MSTKQKPRKLKKPRAGVYSAEFKARIVELARQGRTPESLAEEFEPSSVAIRTWVKQADEADDEQVSTLLCDEREELFRLRRENRQLREEKDILKSRGVHVDGVRCTLQGGWRASLSRNRR